MKDISDAVIEAPAIAGDQLVLPDNNDGLTLADYVPVLLQYRDINSCLVFDYRDKKGNAAARSHVAKIRRVKAPINEIHKRLKADYKAIVDKMDADRREVLAVVEEMIEHHDQYLRLVAEEEAAEEAAEEARLAGQARAARAIEEAKERERLAKEDAERKMRETEERAAREKAEAEARAKAAEESKRREEEQARANLENIKRVHWLIIPELVACGITEEQAKAVIMAIREGKVPAVSINYRWKQ